MKLLKGVIFDLDGVLVTTDCFHYKAWKELADSLGMDFDETVNHKLRGISREASLREIYKHNDRPLPDDSVFNAQCSEKNGRYVELIKKMTPTDILPGALELLESLRAAGIKTAIASASKNTPIVLERTGLDKFIDAVSDGNNISKSKPDPEVFLIAAQRIFCANDECVGIEDAAAGVESIHRAGMTAIGIGEQTTLADYRVEHVSEIDIRIIRHIHDSFVNRLTPA